VGGPESTTAPPPFDPEEYAKSSEEHLIATSEQQSTTIITAALPLNKRIRLTAPLDDAVWFCVNGAVRELLTRFDGTRTLLEALEGVTAPNVLEAVGELFEAKLLVFDP